jgi:predicted MPP superfamily phosphohydrolase
MDGPQGFESYKIMQLSDLHSEAPYGLINAVINKAAAEKPDIIVFTGDMTDEDAKGDFKKLETLVRALREITPVYAVSGNHERWTDVHKPLLKLYGMLGVIPLENISTDIEKNGEKIVLYGVSDPDIWMDEDKSVTVDNTVAKLAPDEKNYNILLFHRANMTENLTGRGFDLILSGHQHGGQIRIPFFGGLLSPYGKWFPKNTAGIYKINKTSVVISRGLGNTVKIPRIFNPPELIFITLEISR